jgi:hypothetical protein
MLWRLAMRLPPGVCLWAMAHTAGLLVSKWHALASWHAPIDPGSAQQGVSLWRARLFTTAGRL